MLDQSPVADDLINHASVKKPPSKRRRMGWGEVWVGWSSVDSGWARLGWPRSRSVGPGWFHLSLAILGRAAA